MPQEGNRLAGSTSPYLLQHAGNPVHWRPWGPEALAEAKSRDRPILLSVGYAACHWCHVMAHESFEDPAVAALMNDSVRQREGRSRGAAGRRRALHGGAACDGRARRLADDDVPHARRRAVLRRHLLAAGAALGTAVVHAGAQRRRRGVARQARGARRAKRRARRPSRRTRRAAGRRRPRARRSRARRRGADAHSRSGQRRPQRRAEIPQRADLPLPVERVRSAPARPPCAARCAPCSTRSAPAASTTISAAASPATRPTASGACRISRRCSTTTRRSSSCSRSLPPRRRRPSTPSARARPSPGSCARCAPATRSPPRSTPIPRAKKAASTSGPPTRSTPFSAPTPPNSPPPTTCAPAAIGKGATCCAALPGAATRRAKRGSPPAARDCSPNARSGARPGRDDKILADWNGLTIAALARASAVFDAPDFLAAAEAAFAFVAANLRDASGGLLHAWRDGRAGAAGLLDDYAAMARAALSLFEATGTPAYLERAEAWADDALGRFGDGDGGFFMSADGGDRLIVRPRPPHDGATPSGASLIVEVFARLHHIGLEPRWRDAAERAARRHAGNRSRAGAIAAAAGGDRSARARRRSRGRRATRRPARDRAGARGARRRGPDDRHAAPRSGAVARGRAGRPAAPARSAGGDAVSRPGLQPAGRRRRGTSDPARRTLNDGGAARLSPSA